MAKAMHTTPITPASLPASRGTPRQRVAVAVIVAALVLIPVAAALAGQSFYLTIVTRIMIFALAALGLNLVLGFGAMVFVMEWELKD